MKTQYTRLYVSWIDSTNNLFEFVLIERTYQEALEIAIRFGYVPPKWYLPWQYLTRKITIKIGDIP